MGMRIASLTCLGTIAAAIVVCPVIAIHIRSCRRGGKVPCFVDDPVESPNMIYNDDDSETGWISILRNGNALASCSTASTVRFPH